MKKIIYIIIGIVGLTQLWGCEDDMVEPAFLHIDAIVVDTTADSQITTGRNETCLPGFTRSALSSCVVHVYYKDGRKAEKLGHMELRNGGFTLPVLSHSAIDSIEVYPAVQQSGVYGTQPPFPYFDKICIKKGPSGETLQFSAGDTLDLDTLHTAYDMKHLKLHLFEPFERDEGSLAFDSVMIWRTDAPDEACDGGGYGMLVVPDTVAYIDCAIKDKFYFSRTELNTMVPSLYLELDTRSDIPFEVYMRAAYTDGGSEDTRGVMVVNPSQEWQHLYINLGKTWNWFNHATEIKLIITALNENGEGGTVRIDNVKVMSSTKFW